MILRPVYLQSEMALLLCLFVILTATFLCVASQCPTIKKCPVFQVLAAKTGPLQNESQIAAQGHWYGLTPESYKLRLNFLDQLSYTGSVDIRVKVRVMSYNFFEIDIIVLCDLELVIFSVSDEKSAAWSARFMIGISKTASLAPSLQSRNEVVSSCSTAKVIATAVYYVSKQLLKKPMAKIALFVKQYKRLC